MVARVCAYAEDVRGTQMRTGSMRPRRPWMLRQMMSMPRIADVDSDVEMDADGPEVADGE